MSEADAEGSPAGLTFLEPTAQFNKSFTVSHHQHTDSYHVVRDDSLRPLSDKGSSPVIL